MPNGLTASEIANILEAGMSPRTRRIDTYQRYFDGTIYDGRPDFMNDASGVPLQERAPCIVYPATKNAAGSFTTMCLGDGRFPRITSLTDENDQAFDARFGLNENDSSVVDAGTQKIVEQTRFETVAQQALETALASGTAVVLGCIVKGKLRITQLDPKCTTPTFAEDDPDTVQSVEVSYRYVADEWDAQEKKYKRAVYQYRRVIDDKFDTIYQPVSIKTADDFPTPTTEKTKYKHGFGFCPIVWYKFCAPIAATGDIDGSPVHRGLLQLVDAVNMSLSQRHRAALYCGDPQIVETGVEPDGVRTPTGRSSEARTPTSDPSGWQMGLREKRAGGFGKRQKGAGTVWQYDSPDSRVEILTLSGDALKCLDDDAKDNVKKLREALGHVYIEPEDITGSGDISGKTLECVYRQQIAKCNRIREDFGRCFILPVINMLYRIVLKSGDGLYLAGADKLRKVLQRFEQQVGAGKDVAWFDPSLKLKWGDYFDPSDIDEATRLDVAIKGLTAPTPIITRKTAIAHVKSIFSDIQNVDQYDDKLQEEADQRTADLHDAMTAMNGDNASQGTAAKPPGAGNSKSPASARKAQPAKPAVSPKAAP